jgi:hypothetical protein
MRRGVEVYCGSIDYVMFIRCVRLLPSYAIEFQIVVYMGLECLMRTEHLAW